MLEAIIARVIRKYFDEHKLTSQHGFSKGKSCLTNLLSFYRKEFETRDKGDEYDIVFWTSVEPLTEYPIGDA